MSQSETADLLAIARESHDRQTAILREVTQEFKELIAELKTILPILKEVIGAEHQNGQRIERVMAALIKYNEEIKRKEERSHED